ncbi:hypothetical protein BGX38DRAFT_1153967 [Terfezia claveryi]|nr:hypothetical protein BGX38DRAFT_1153967 [Terfezia claveryi]
MPESLVFSANSPTPGSTAFLSPGAPTLASSRPTSPANIDQHKSSRIAKGKLKAKDPPPPIKVPKSPVVKTSESQSPPSPSSPKYDPTSEYPTTAELHLNQYITRDLLHAAAIATQASQLNELSRSKRKEIEFYQTLKRERQVNPGAVFGYGYQGYGNGYTNAKQSRLLYPCERKKPGSRTSRELRVSRSSLQAQAEEGECLVPIRLEIDYDKYRLRDTFTWNLHDRTVPIELFAEQLVEDFRLPPLPPLIKMIAEQIHAQVTDFHPHVHLPDEPLDPKLPYWAYKNDEMRVLIKLNITIGQYTLVDQFEWDINNPVNSPEGFAQQMARDMCLSGEFTTAIAHSIREQCQLYTKYLYQTGHTFDGRPVEDAELKSAMLSSPLLAIVRTTAQTKEYEPVLYELSDGELEKMEKDWSRESRRKRRVNRRGGPSLPDLKEMPKTNRSQILSTILPGAVTRVADMKITSDKPKEPDSEDDSESDTAVATPPLTVPSAVNTMTRRQRGAAANAALLLRASAGRSQTPEVSQLQLLHTPHHHHTPSTHLPRRPGVPFNVDSALVKLKVGRERLMKWGREQQKKDQAKYERDKAEWEKSQREKQLRQQQQQQQSKVPARGTPAEGQNILSKVTTPAVPGIKTETGAPGTPQPAASMTAPGQIQAQSAPPSQQNGDEAADPAHPPPCPEWLEAGLSDLHKLHPNDNFEGIMRYTVTDSVTGNPIGQNLPKDPANIKHQFIPRIRCYDCPGKLYTPGTEMTVDNFKLHLNNRGHRMRVEERMKAKAALGS